ncbi:MAG TPA: MlaE family lipid ABC transporter permease subunit [Candidatus Cloacimonadota bacterium]|jgi:phospholipid/cholesterol/gamma-HCH transport system permease protein|nr:MlaE family lipid ABC transporter permease subunit [Candidatus Cloacimonadales bacterium]HPY96405.1 MlaE family lipid ABC transporter permease subunit [Candidatus Cloacimonadota bacterium]HQB41022.1 MlaE family lipid ABC transporter permease subunit [Candidatus Cloacimonadota bacterium]
MEQRLSDLLRLSPDRLMLEYKIEDKALFLIGSLNKDTIPEIYENISKEKNLSEIDKISLEGLEQIDSAGVALLDELIIASGKDLPLTGMSQMIKDTVSVFESRSLPESSKPRKIYMFEAVGDKIVKFFNEIFEMLVLTTDIVYWSVIGLWNRKGQRKGSFTQQGVLIGVDALPIVALLSFIIGFIISLQSASQLKQFGANIFLANLIAISMVRELGPLVTAIIVAGRSGSAIASEIATMKVTEEIDALKMMALNPIRYVVVPKFHAVTICMPLLVLFSIMVGVFGGLLVGVYYLDLSLVSFLNSCLQVTALKDIVISMAKSTVFAWQIVIVGSHYGFQVTGGAEGVGKATTTAVVISIFSVIVMDAAFSLLYMI